MSPSAPGSAQHGAGQGGCALCTITSSPPAGWLRPNQGAEAEAGEPSHLSSPLGASGNPMQEPELADETQAAWPRGFQIKDNSVGTFACGPTKCCSPPPSPSSGPGGRDAVVSFLCVPWCPRDFPAHGGSFVGYSNHSCATPSLSKNKVRPPLSWLIRWLR